MGKDIAENFKSSMDIFNRANEVLGFDLKDLCFNGPEEKLRDTSITQPALYTTSAAILEAIKQETGIKPSFTAGHSLGEYTAYYGAGYITFEEGLRAVRRRGELMRDADPEGKGTMYAVLKLDDEEVIEICKKASKEGIIVPANFNCPGQVVISGEKKALAGSSEMFKEAKARVMPLPVGGAFHSPLMKPANDELEKYLKSSFFTIKPTEVQVLSNVYADVPLNDKIIDSLIEQLLSPVRWTASMKNLIGKGIDLFIEIGSGSVLQGLMKKIDRDANILSIEDCVTLNDLKGKI
jgi:[acyl-carrier-protein] S-malonyltransferase